MDLGLLEVNVNRQAKSMMVNRDEEIYYAHQQDALRMVKSELWKN